jgi:DNA topoisomerase-3
MPRVFLCEKPSQARDIARELGSPKDMRTHLETDGGIVTFAIGHLLELVEPEDYDPKFKTWRMADLPILPADFRLEKKTATATQLAAIGKLLKTATEVVISTDADREGEMIGWEILDHFRYTKAVRRLWLSALDPESVRKALGKLRDGEASKPLYLAAKARSEADWLVGMNMTRAASICSQKPGVRSNSSVSIGRVQTPTLALVVRRDREIEAFVPKDYFEIVAKVDSCGSVFSMRHSPQDDDRVYTKEAADKIAASAKGVTAPLKVVDEPKKTAPPKLFSLSLLQGAASAKWGWPGDKTLEVAQALYETHKVTSYPRTDCNFLPEEQVGEVPAILASLRSGVLSHLPDWEPQIRKSVFDTKKVTAHHAIIPTKMKPSGRMSSDESKLYLLVAATYAACTMPDYEFRSVKATMQAGGAEFVASGTTPIKEGWKAAFRLGGGAAADEEEEIAKLPALEDGSAATVQDTSIEGKRTKPPARYTDGTLIEAMKSIAKFVEDPAKKATLRETSGIGTEATRANILKTLRNRAFIENKGKQILSTQKARQLIDWLEAEMPALADPAETAVWEDGLEAIASGASTPQKFLDGIAGRLREYIQTASKHGGGQQTEAPMTPTNVVCPKSGEPVLDQGNAFFFPGFPEFRAWKTVSSREMGAAEYAAVLAGEGEELAGFVAMKSRKKFSARLVFDAESNKASFKFSDDARTAAGPGGESHGSGGNAVDGVVCPKSGEPVLDRGKTFFFPGFPEFAAWKTKAGREMSAAEYASVLAGEGEELSGFVSTKSGKKFSAKLIFDAQSNMASFKFA